MEFKKHPSVGEILIQQGVITEGQFKLAESEKKATGRTLAKVLIDLGFIDESRLIQVQSDSLEMPFVDLKGFPVNSNLIKLLPEAQARRYRAIVLEETADALKVGVVDPFDLFSVDEIKRTLGKKINLAIVREAEINAIFDSTYTNDEEISSLAQELETDLVDTGMNFSLSDANATAEQSDAPVVRFIDNIFNDAVKNKASDIHIEPEEKQIRIRLRIDGILHERIIKEKRIATAIVMRLKIMCDLDISEKRIPQDGRFQMTLKDRKIDVRLSTMPTPYGESMVMRLLDQTSIDLDIGALNMPPAVDARFRMLISRSHGMFLVTGPTGSGKTTTLYSALNALNKPENKVITAEDPIEYRMERINQVQVNTKVGLTFSAVLRAALRQDPDIILVGEIRDGETAEIALKAAMTGHLVLSTLHTNDAISSAFRLVDMGAKPFVVGSSVLGFMAQRLIKRICSHCIQDQELDHQQRALIRAIAENDAEAALQSAYKQGKGCNHCNNTGYKGRIGVYELLQMTENLTTALQKNDADLFTQIARKQEGYEPLSKCALRYAMQGITSLDEVFQLATSDRMLTGIEADEAL